MTPCRPHFYPVSIPRSSVFRATADGLPLDVLFHPAADHTALECGGPVEIELEVDGLAGHVVIRPLRLGIVACVQGELVRFTLDGPQNLQIEIEGKPLLYLYALPPAPAAPEGPNVRRFKSSQIYDVGLIVLGENEICWIDAGAVVRGSIRAEGVSGVRIGGYGILDGGYWLEQENRRRRALILDHCCHSRIETILMLSPCHWMVVIGACEDIVVVGVRQIANDVSSDGVDIVGSKRVQVLDCCLHNGDDNIALKALSNVSAPDELSGRRYLGDGWKSSIEDILISGCIFYNIHGGTAMEIGYETSTPLIRNVRFENIDVLAVHQFGSVFGIHNGDRAHVKNIVWDDIRVERHYDTLIDFRVLRARWNIDPDRGSISNITLRNIRALQSPYNQGYTVSIIAGYDVDHPVTGVIIENFELGGRLIQNADELDLVTRHAHGILFRQTTPAPDWMPNGERTLVPAVQTSF